MHDTQGFSLLEYLLDLKGLNKSFSTLFSVLLARNLEWFQQQA